MVVVLYPHNSDGSPGNSLVDQSLRSAFAAGSTGHIEIYDEYLDISHPWDADSRQLQVEYLRHKYARRKVDLVIAGLSSGLDFVLDHRQAIFPGVPIVFCAVDHREVQTRKLPPDVIGVPVNFDLAATLELALRLHPKTERIFVIAGKEKMDKAWESEARLVFRRYEGGLEFVYWSGLALPDLLRRVASLPEHSLVYYLHVLQDGTGKALVPAHVLEHLAQVANAPIYGHLDSYVGRGIVGGRVSSFETEGKNAARLGLRILAGERPENIGVQEPSENAYLFDVRQLRRWGISEGSLPPGSVVRYQEPGPWNLYKWQIIGVISLCVIQSLLIFGLLVQRASRKQAEARFRQVVEAAPNGMLMVGPDGNIVLVNAMMEKLFGYRQEEMLGRPVEMLVPERFRKQHSDHRDSFFAAPQDRYVGAGRDLFGRRKNGTEFPLEIGLTSVRTNTGPCVLASVIDITERKQADMALRASESRFRLMADAAPVMIWMSGPDKLCTYFNKSWLDFTGQPLERELGNGWSEGVHADDLQRCLDTYNRAFDARHSFRMEYRLQRFDGEYRWVLDAGVPRFKPDGAFEGYIGSCIDISDEKRVAEALRESHCELRVLTGRLLHAQESERRRIARELHDDLNQSLALLSVEMELLGQEPPGSPTLLRGRMHELSARIKQLSSSVHNLSHQLHPSNLEQLGLLTAVRSLCKELTESHDLSIDFSHHQVPEVIPGDTALCLYRIVQEALRNVIKHSGAEHADVELSGSAGGICLRIVDNGAGFTPSAEHKGGLGLVSMRERLRLVGGEIAIESLPSAGTRVEVFVPLRAVAQKYDAALKEDPAGV
jgi:PAS domain S-box-containing protein